MNLMTAGLAERERLQDLFGRHVGVDVARQALETGVVLGGERRIVAALFVDITGSTGLALQRGPQETVALLNRFFAVVVDAVSAGGGLVNKFQGDAALCVFGAPNELADPATAALVAARRIIEQVRAAGELGIGVGVAYGEVVAGQVGALSRLEYTIIGDAVNQAARLTELAKSRPGQSLASGETVQAASADERTCWTPCGETVLRGRSQSTQLFEPRPD
jgi:adenylate cyclase